MRRPPHQDIRDETGDGADNGGCFINDHDHRGSQARRRGPRLRRRLPGSARLTPSNKQVPHHAGGLGEPVVPTVLAIRGQSGRGAGSGGISHPLLAMRPAQPADRLLRRRYIGRDRDLRLVVGRRNVSVPACVIEVLEQRIDRIPQFGGLGSRQEDQQVFHG